MRDARRIPKKTLNKPPKVTNVKTMSIINVAFKSVVGGSN